MYGFIRVDAFKMSPGDIKENILQVTGVTGLRQETGTRPCCSSVPRSLKIHCLTSEFTRKTDIARIAKR